MEYRGMKWLAPLLLLLALASPAKAQCNGVFGTNQVCGSVSGGPPGPVNITAFPVGGRAALTTATTFWYRTDGNNACNGSVNTGGSSGNCAFADPAGCMNYLAQFVDFSNQNVTCLAGETTPKAFAPPSIPGYQCPPNGFTGGGTFTLAGNLNQATVTTPVASPGVVNWANHGLSVGSPIYLTVTGGSLPTGLNNTQLFYVIAAGFGTNSFEVSTSSGGSAVNFTGSSTGTQTGNALTTTIDGTVNSASGIAIANPGCWMTVQNFQIKALVNSLNCIAHNGFSGFNWNNIIWLGSGVNDVFVGTGCNDFQTGTDWIAGQININLPHLETDGSSEIRNSGQTTNISANLTYGTAALSFVYSSFHGRITYTKSPTINLNGFTVTGQKCYAEDDGLIEQFGLGANFFPGTVNCSAGIGGLVVQ